MNGRSYKKAHVSRAEIKKVTGDGIKHHCNSTEGSHSDNGKQSEPLLRLRIRECCADGYRR